MKSIPPATKDDPLWNSTRLSQLTSLQEIHGIDDGMVSVDAEGHQDVGRGVEQHDLEMEVREEVWLRRG